MLASEIMQHSEETRYECATQGTRRLACRVDSESLVAIIDPFVP